MKISNVAATLLAFAPVSRAMSLFSTSHDTTAKAQIVIQGVLHDFSNKDLAIINDSAQAAYNAVQKDTSFTLQEVKPLLYFGAGENKNLEQCHYCPPDDDTFVNQCHYCPPDDDAITTSKAGFEQILMADIKVRSTQCHYCPPDDDAVAPLESAENHKVFEMNFCDLLATSGSANLANAHHCSFTFLGGPGHKVAPLSLVKRTDASKKDASLGFLIVTGLIHNLSEKDLALIEKEALETYNDAFVGTGTSFASIKVRSGVVAANSNNGLTQCHYCPPDDDTFSSAKQGLTQCHYCPPDDDTTVSSTSNQGSVSNVLFLDIKIDESASKVTQCHYCPPDDDAITTSKKAITQCHYCPPDDDAIELESTDVDKRTRSLAFSRALCSKLRMSGLPNLAFAEDCALEFFFSQGEASA